MHAASSCATRCSPPRTRLGAAAGVRVFPSARSLAQDDLFKNFTPLLPATLLIVPRVPPGRGHRVRQRWSQARELILRANCILKELNNLNGGLRANRASSRPQSTVSEAMLLLHRHVLELAAQSAQERRDLSRIAGAQVVAELIRSEQVDRYSFAHKSFNQVSLLGEALDEPTPFSPTVDLLSALPPDEAFFYSKEENVVDLNTKSQVLFDQIQKQYGFVSGSYEQYLSYFLRTDIDADLWRWTTGETVKSIAGFAAVAKKDVTKQRKLIMMCGTNYYWSDARARTALGMTGGAGLATIFVPGGSAYFACWDESTAFTSVVTPEWMWPWTTCPPVRAADVRHLLPAGVSAKLADGDFAYPMYTRLAMGGSHSVHILMAINIHTVGRTMVRSCRFHFSSQRDVKPVEYYDIGDDSHAESDDHQEVPPLEPEEDELWAAAHIAKKISSSRGAVMRARVHSVAELSNLAREAKMSGRRVFVVAHLFSGAHREHDLEWCLRVAAAQQEVDVLVASGDLGNDVDWDIDGSRQLPRSPRAGGARVDRRYRRRATLQHVEPASLSSRRTKTSPVTGAALGPP